MAADTPVLPTDSFSRLAYTPKAAADLLNCSTWLIHQKISSGEIAAKKVSRRKTLIPAESLRAWLANLPDRTNAVAA